LIKASLAAEVMGGTVRDRVKTYFETLAQVIREAEVTDRRGRRIELDRGLDQVRRAAHAAHEAGNKIMFVGNGGSAGIASHLSIDFSKNGKLRAMAFNDPSALTCLGNDLGYDSVFSTQLEFHARAGDLLIAISSSGSSPNILSAVETARERDCGVVTFSGFAKDNALRRMGDVNFYLRSDLYGFVEVGHLSLCHAVLDLHLGWGAQERVARVSNGATV
jgi:D-sedoheptulose 7-phosphate isomerase